MHGAPTRSKAMRTGPPVMVTTAVSSPLNGTLVPAGALTWRDAVPVATYSQSVPAGAWESSGAGSTVLGATEPGAEDPEADAGAEAGVEAGVDAGVDAGEEVGVTLADAVRDGAAEVDSGGGADWGIRPQPTSTTGGARRWSFGAVPSRAQPCHRRPSGPAPDAP